MSEYKFSAARTKLGFVDRYIADPRARFCGSSYWLVASPEAVPQRVREKCERKGTFRGINKAVAPARAALGSGRTIAVRFGQAKRRRISGLGESWVRPIEPEHFPLNNSRLSLCVNAYFADWVEASVPRKGRWLLSIESGMLINARGSQLQVVLMPIRLLPSEIAEVAA